MALPFLFWEHWAGYRNIRIGTLTFGALVASAAAVQTSIVFVVAVVVVVGAHVVIVVVVVVSVVAVGVDILRWDIPFLKTVADSCPPGWMEKSFFGSSWLRLMIHWWPCLGGKLVESDRQFERDVSPVAFEGLMGSAWRSHGFPQLERTKFEWFCSLRFPSWRFFSLRSCCCFHSTACLLLLLLSCLIQLNQFLQLLFCQFPFTHFELNQLLQ